MLSIIFLMPWLNTYNEQYNLKIPSNKQQLYQRLNIFFLLKANINKD